LDSRLFGELLRSFSAVPLGWGLRSGALDNVGNDGAVAVLKRLGWLFGFGNGAVFWDINTGRPFAGLNGFFADLILVGEGTRR
jgi:hypothetical protein